MGPRSACAIMAKKNMGGSTYKKAPSFFLVENCHDMRATLTQHVVHAQASLVVLLRELVVGGALLARHEALELKLLAGPHHGGDPLALLTERVPLLRDDLSPLVLRERGLAETTLPM